MRRLCRNPETQREVDSRETFEDPEEWSLLGTSASLYAGMDVDESSACRLGMAAEASDADAFNSCRTSETQPLLSCLFTQAHRPARPFLRSAS
jgi:hypothetical protein